MVIDRDVEQCPRVISVTSGKGGVGKTLTTVHLAVAFQQMGFATLIVDGDLGMSNIDVVLGLKAHRHLRHVLDGSADIDDVILQGPGGVAIVPSGSGIATMAQLTDTDRKFLSDAFAQVFPRYDVVLIDTSPGISQNVIHLADAADHVLLITTPEPHAMTDAYALIKVLHQYGAADSINLLVNMARSEEEAGRVSQRIAATAMTFLGVSVSDMGHVPYDPSLQNLIMAQKVGGARASSLLAGQAWTKLAYRISDKVGAAQPWRQATWRRLFTGARELSIG